MDLQGLRTEYDTLTEELSNPELVSDWERFQDISKRRSQLQKIVDKAKELDEIAGRIAENRQILASQEEPELTSLAEQELSSLSARQSEVEKEIENLIREKDATPLPAAVIVEIRPGTGGEEAALFGADLCRMYTKYAEQKGWKQTMLNWNDTEIGGLKEAAFELSGPDVYPHMKYESGVHRVQRIPDTEKSGRIHTSTASVVVMPKPTKEQITIKPDDIRIDLYRASGKGGQNVNKRETAVRIVHIPTGVTVTSQTQRNQQQNKDNALSLLAARLIEAKEEADRKNLSQERKSQIGTSDRSEKIRTYNFPQDRVTDHRIPKSWHGLERILEGDMDEISEDLAAAEAEQKE